MIRRVLAVLLLGALALALPRQSTAQAGSVLGWGYNNYGELGDNTAANHSLPASAFFMSGIKQVSAGGLHTLALTTDGHVYAWGYNGYGQLGDGTTTDRHTPVTRYRPRPCRRHLRGLLP
jgi:Alpha-tubulin suppressor and related RCC1 domain-containing proteins